MIGDGADWNTVGRQGITRREWQVTGLGPASIEVDMARGARISSFLLGNHELLVPRVTGATSPFQDGLFLMAPYAGRVRDAEFEWNGERLALPASAPPHAAHGIVADIAWNTPSLGTFTSNLDHRWPFRAWASMQVETLSSGLRLEALVGVDDLAMPTNIGWHPWFRRRIDGVEGALDWEVPTAYLTDGVITKRSIIPRTRAMRAWTAPSGTSDPVVRWPNLFDLRMSSACARCWVIYETPDAICVEPQTAPGDALNAGDAVIVKPNQPSKLDLELNFVDRRGSGSGEELGHARQDGRNRPRPPSHQDWTTQS